MCFTCHFFVFCAAGYKWNEAAKRIDVLIAEDKYITQSDIDELIRRAKYTVKNHKITSEYDKAVVDNAKKILAEYGVDIQENTDISETKSPVEKILEKAEAAGVPVETVSEEKAVFMDVRDETFITVQQVDEGIEYSVYAADLLATMEKNIAPVSDYDNFIELADGNSDKDIPAELAKIKADVFAKINLPQKNISDADSTLYYCPT